MVVRRALGATSYRVVRQLLTEGLLLACTSGVLGFVAVYAVSPSIVGIANHFAGTPQFSSPCGQHRRILCGCRFVGLGGRVWFGASLARREIQSRIVLASGGDFNRTSRKHGEYVTPFFLSQIAVVTIYSSRGSVNSSTS